jgi:hypothetical protein
MRQIALLRGINLGARNRIAMPELREHLTDLGYDLDAGGPPDDGLDDALTGYRKRTGRG